MGRGAPGGGWYNNFRIPFHASIRVTCQLNLPADADSASTVVYVILRGTEDLPTVIGGVALPPSARLVQSRIEQRVFARLDFVTLLDIPAGSGLLFSHTLAASSVNPYFMEGCYHAFMPHDAAWPGLTVSTGTEDYFDSAYYFNGGGFHQANAGLTHWLSNDSLTEVSAYRMHDQDVIAFAGGFRFVWRVGDVNDAAGHKCTLRQGGDPELDPQNTTVTAYTWAYVWPESDTPSVSLSADSS